MREGVVKREFLIFLTETENDLIVKFWWCLNGLFQLTQHGKLFAMCITLLQCFNLNLQLKLIII